MKKRIFAVLVLGIVIPAVSFAASISENTAPVVAVFDGQLTNPSGSQAPGDQYIFFGANSKVDNWSEDSQELNLIKLSDFSVTAPTGNAHLIPASPASSNFAKVIAPGGTPVVNTGIVYNNQGKAFQDLVSFRIINPNISSFSVWILDNTGRASANGNIELALCVNGGDPLASCKTTQTDLGNEFTKFTVTGATISDVFTVAVRGDDSKQNFRSIAGLTFKAIPDPTAAKLKNPIVYHQGWNDLNKNGRMDIFEDSTRPLEKRVENLLGQMTQAEKIGQLNQSVLGWEKNKNFAKFFPAIRRSDISSFIWGRSDPALRNQFQRIAVQESRLGIPIIFGNDMIHGASTLFPISLALACSFEPELFERAQTVAARESRAEGVDWVFAPMCDLARDPRWGRVAETCGEDPYLSSLCNAAQVRGFQGTNPAAPDRVAACLKHYVGYSAVTGGRDYNDSEVSEWTLRNAHLPSFHAGVKAGALTIMSSFNSLEGIPAAANPHTLTEILRDEWKFSGFVVSDWEAVSQMVQWGYAKDKADAARLAINAGNDMDMLSESFVQNLAEEVKAGRIFQATVDEAVRRVLRVKFQVGLFEQPYVNEEKYKSALTHPEDLALARECVTKSTVMLKNTGVLPLSKEIRKVALIGPVGDDHVEVLGCWTGRTGWTEMTLAKALREALPNEAVLTVIKGASINTTPSVKTLQNGKVVPDENAPPTDAELKIEEAVRAAQEAEVVIMAVGEPKGWTGENASRAHLTLTGKQQALFDAVAATGRPIVTLVFSGRPLSLPAVWEKSAAVLYAWQPGTEAGAGLADLLVGKVAPSGRLSMSVPRDVAQVPVYYNQYNTGRPGSGQYRDISSEPQYWFGYGLTYTTFEYSPVRIKPATNGMPAEATVTITNTGKREGVEVAQLYIHQMVCHEGARPRQELRGFKRISLQPGEKADITFLLTSEILGYIDRQGIARADAGEYEVWIAPSAHNGSGEKFKFEP